MFSLRNGDYRVHVLPLPLHIYVVGYATLWIRPSWRRRHAFSKAGTTGYMSCLYLSTITWYDMQPYDPALMEDETCPLKSDNWLGCCVCLSTQVELQGNYRR